MKKFLFLILLLSSFVTKARVTTNDTSTVNTNIIYRSSFKNAPLYNYSIGFKFLSIEEFPKILDESNPDVLRHSIANGFIFKINDNQISYRILGNFYSDRFSIKNEYQTTEELLGRLNDNHIKIGFEKNINYGIVQPYFGFDFGIKRSVFKGNIQNNFARGLSATASDADYDVRTEKTGFSISPVFGFKVNLVNHFTIAAESTIDIFYSYERQERTNRNLSQDPSLRKYNKWEYLLKPVGMLSLQYNFAALY